MFLICITTLLIYTILVYKKRLGLGEKAKGRTRIHINSNIYTYMHRKIYRILHKYRYKYRQAPLWWRTRLQRPCTVNKKKNYDFGNYSSVDQVGK